MDCNDFATLYVPVTSRMENSHLQNGLGPDTPVFRGIVAVAFTSHELAEAHGEYLAERLPEDTGKLRMRPFNKETKVTGAPIGDAKPKMVVLEIDVASCPQGALVADDKAQFLILANIPGSALSRSIRLRLTPHTAAMAFPMQADSDEAPMA